MSKETPCCPDCAQPVKWCVCPPEQRTKDPPDDMCPDKSVHVFRTEYSSDLLRRGICPDIELHDAAPPTSNPSDIVERLRRYGDGLPNGILLMREAADLIEKLRATDETPATVYAVNHVHPGKREDCPRCADKS